MFSPNCLLKLRGLAEDARSDAQSRSLRVKLEFEKVVTSLQHVDAPITKTVLLGLIPHDSCNIAMHHPMIWIGVTTEMNGPKSHSAELHCRNILSTTTIESR
jgi:hypothetical protein